MRALCSFVATLALVAASPLAHADAADFTGVVTKVFDGDSFLVRPAGRQDIDVRLMDIDAPEKDQPYGGVSRAALKQLLEGRRVFVDAIETDRYGRTIARVYREPDRLDITRTLVQTGQVWVNRRYAKDRSLIALEEAARAKQAGLWALPAAQRLPPWEFRRKKRP